MKIDKKNPNPGVWFDHEGDEKFSLRLRIPIGRAHREIMAQVTTSEDKEVNGKIEKNKITDTELLEALLIDYCIADWKGFTDDKGKLKCTLENKKFLINEVPVVAAFYLRSINKLQDMLTRRAGEAEKN